MNIMGYLFIGILCGIVIEKYIFPYFDIKVEVFTHKASVEATAHQLEAQEMAVLFNRQYPETKEPIEEKTPAIGFAINNSETFDDDCEDRKIGFKK